MFVFIVLNGCEITFQQNLVVSFHPQVMLHGSFLIKSKLARHNYYANKLFIRSFTTKILVEEKNNKSSKDERGCRSVDIHSNCVCDLHSTNKTKERIGTQKHKKQFYELFKKRRF